MGKVLPKADGQVADYRYEEARRKNNPPAGLTAQGRIAEEPKERYAYNPHLPPVLRFDSTGGGDDLPPLLSEARRRRLNEDEVKLLAEALRNHEPWLEWAGKRERPWFEVDPVALHIHERVAAKAIVSVAARKEVQRSLFADPELTYREAVQFYQHDVDWANRLILGDSLQVMSSLAKREGLAGQVQMIYMDPPYGIKYSSNFQSTIGQRDVKDRPSDLTREPEMVKAYRDTWTLGIHSYLAYLRDRLVLSRELLSESGSIFVQIGDENVHRVRSLMDEVFGAENFVSQISFAKTTGFSGLFLSSVTDTLLWYAKLSAKVKFTNLFKTKNAGDEGATKYRPALSFAGLAGYRKPDSRLATSADLTSQGASLASEQGFHYRGRVWTPPAGLHWKTTVEGLRRLAGVDRIIVEGDSLRYVRFLDDFPVFPQSNVWLDIGGIQSRTNGKVYVVQTATEAVKRCLLMTTDPGDLVLDPTCGSGTTAYVAEQWGRRWITIDTSRVALAIARQRILTATFAFYRLRDEEAGPSGGFVYKAVPHITLKSIAQNVALDPIFARHEPVLAEKLAALNAALARVTPEVRTRLATKLAEKERAEGKRAVTEADRRRWLLPKEQWQEWEVPYDADPDWPAELREALTAYRAAWRAKMDEVNATIAASAEQEELVDQPEVVRGVTRVSGPFTVEAVLPPEERLDEGPSPIDDYDEEMATFDEPARDARDEPQNADAYLTKMIQLLRDDGVRFLGNKQVTFTRLEPLYEDVLHAEGEWVSDGGEPRRVAVSLGPQYGDMSAKQVEDALWSVSRRGYDDIIFAAFGFDAAAQGAIQADPNPRVRAHLAQIAPDVNPGMDGLLKTTASSQLFTVMGLPRTRLNQTPDGQWTVSMEGVDIYDPVTNGLHSTEMDKVAAWFVDSDYDGRTFCICQAFFPDKSAWKKLAKSLGNKGVVDADAFAAFSGTTSLPFPSGQHGKVAVKVIDPRGNEVMRVHALREESVYA